MASKVEVEVGLKSGAVATGLAKIRGQFAQLRGHLNSDLGSIVSIGGLIAGITALNERLDRVKDLSDRFGETAESIQRVGEAAKLFGSDMEGVAVAINKVTLNALKAARDGGVLQQNFLDLGIDANEFVNLPLEEKLVALSRAYGLAKGSGEGLAKVLEILGRSGGELVPLLAQGPEQLRSTLDSAMVASQQVVDSVDAFNDSLIKLQGAAAVVFGFVIQSFLTIAASFGTMAGAVIGSSKAMFSGLAEGWGLYGRMVKAVLTANVGDFNKVTSEIPKLFSRTIEQTAAAVQGAGDEFRSQMDEIWGDKSMDRPKGDRMNIVDREAMEDAAADEKKVLAERKRALEDFEKFKDKVAEDAAVKSRKRQEDDIQKFEEILASQKKLTDTLRGNQLDTLQPNQKINFLKREITELDEQIKNALDPKKKLDLKIEREERVGDVQQIENDQRDLRERSLGQVVADSLAEIGGGGNVGGGASDPLLNEQRQSNVLLQKIVENTARSTETKALLMKP